MLDRHVTHVRKNHDGDITALGNLEEHWLYEKEDVIKDIRGHKSSYHVLRNGQWVKIGVVSYTRQPGDYLRTFHDDVKLRDDLDDLPPYPP